MAEKSNSRRHSTTGFGVNLSVAETSYQILEILSFAIEIGLLKPPLIKNNYAGISGKNKAFFGVYFLGIREKKTLLQSSSSNLKDLC